MKIENIKIRNELQAMMHDLGREEFLNELVQAMYNASQEMEDISTIKSEDYRCTATSIQELVEIERE